MKAIILAAGVGKRLAQFLKESPKCLLEFNGKSMLRRLIDDLSTSDVTDIVIVVGYQKEKIYDELKDINKLIDKKINIKYVVNDDFKTGSIISLWKARHELNDDTIIMDADVICHKKLINKLVNSTRKSCFLIDSGFEDTGEEQKLGVVNGRVMTISKAPLNGTFDLVGESIGFLKLSKTDCLILSKALSNDVDKGINDCEHEEVYDRILKKCNVGYETVDQLPWIEVDFMEDVKRAEEIVMNSLNY